MTKNNCIVLKLKESVNNPDLYKLGERTFQSVNATHLKDQFNIVGMRFSNDKEVTIKCYNCYIRFKDNVSSEVNLSQASFPATTSVDVYNLVGFGGVSNSSYLRIENADSLLKITALVGVNDNMRMDTSFFDFTDMKYSSLQSISLNGCSASVDFANLPDTLTSIAIGNARQNYSQKSDPLIHLRKISGRASSFTSETSRLAFPSKWTDAEFNAIFRNGVGFRMTIFSSAPEMPFQEGCDIAALLNGTTMSIFWVTSGNVYPFYKAVCTTPLTAEIRNMRLLGLLFDNISDLINLLSFEMHRIKETIYISTSLSEEEAIRNTTFLANLSEKVQAGYTVTIYYNLFIA